MIVVKKLMTRRTVLRGLGAAVALPLLDAMRPAVSAAATPVRRFAAVYVPNGVAMHAWTPAATGAAFELSPILQPLEPFRDHLLVVSGLNGAGGFSHTGATTEFLTGVKVREQTVEGTTAGTSIDQLMAKEFGNETQLASLQLSLDSRDGVGSCDGQSCELSNSISWRTPRQLLPPEDDPRAVFERMFGDSGTTDPYVRAKRLKRDRSVLDSVLESAARLQRGLGVGDKRKIDEYLESVRDVERRIQLAEKQSARELPVVSRPASVPTTFGEHAKVMFDLELLAFQSDLTRVITLLFGKEYSGRTYPEIGVSEAHHPLSHHQNDPQKLEANAKVNTYHTTTVTYFLDKLRSTADGDGSLLDHTFLFYGGGLSDGNRHDDTNLPLLLVGGRRFFMGDRHLKFSGIPSSNLLLAIMNKMGVPIESIGDSTGALDIG